MCTLTYYPTRSGFILTHSRDEDPKRPSSQKIQNDPSPHGKVYFPQDLEAGGSWMGSSEQGRTVCLLNGGSVAYTAKEQYPASRGNIVLECLKASSVETFYATHDFSLYEPFTLIAAERQHLYQITHDPERTHLDKLDPQEIQVWSSTKLYDSETRLARRNRFWQFLSQNASPNAKDLKGFHLRPFHQEDEGAGFKIKQEGIIETVSLTQAQLGEDSLSFSYYHLPTDQLDHLRIALA